MQNFLIGQLTVDRSKCFVISSDHKSLNYYKLHYN